MKTIFEQGSLREYSQVRLDEAVAPVLEHTQFAERRTTVFISHKHDDLEDLKGLLGFLEKEYCVKVYIDSRDPSMPPNYFSTNCAQHSGENKGMRQIYFACNQWRNRVEMV